MEYDLLPVTAVSLDSEGRAVLYAGLGRSIPSIFSPREKVVPVGWGMIRQSMIMWRKRILLMSWCLRPTESKWSEKETEKCSFFVARVARRRMRHSRHISAASRLRAAIHPA